MIISLESLLDQLPIPSERYSAGEHRAIQMDPATVAGYVWPTLEVDDESYLSAPILLISAPGAMGKSEAARSIARRLHTPYVDLAKINVGSGTLLGELVKALGPAKMDEFKEDVRSGRATLVLDSTDEAQLRSGTDNYVEFLKDLEWFINDDHVGPRIIMLGRSDSISMTEIALTMLNRPSPILELQPLTYSQALGVIDATLDSRGYTLHREQPEPFARFRDAVLASLARALTASAAEAESLETNWSLTATFLGYPPVLLAISERLKSPNPHSEVANFNSESGSTIRRQRGELLREIAEHILDREASKVRKGLGESLGISQGNPLREALYGRDEQAARILDLTGTRGVSLERPAALSDDERSRYEELVAGFVPDHPFVRGQSFASQVFSDYLRAWAVSSPMTHLMSTERAPFLASLPIAGPFFARFLAALTPEEHPTSIPEDLVDDAIKSHAAGSPGARAFYTHRGGESPRLRLLDEDPRLADDEVSFEITEFAGALTLHSPLSRTVVLSDYGVVLRAGPGGQLDIGPEVLLIAGEIEISAQSVHVVSNEKSPGTSVLAAHDTTTHDRDLRVVTYSPQDLVISWPNPWHQWKAYQIPLHDGPYPVGRLLASQVVVAVRKLLLAFHRTSESPAVSAEKVDRLLVGGNDIAISVRDGLVELGVMELVGNQYYLDLSRLGQFGISWQNVRADDPFANLLPFCEKVINTKVFSSRHLST